MEVKTPIRLAILELGGEAEASQTLISLKAVLKAFPNLEIEAVVSKSGYELFSSAPFIQKVYLFDTLTIDSKLDAVTELESVLERPYKVVFNCSVSETSSYLTTLIPGTLKLGYGRHLDGTLAIYDAWTAYTHALCQASLKQGIHRIDILATQLLTCLQLHFQDPVENSELPVSTKSFFQTKPDGPMELPNWHTMSHKWIAIELDEHSFSSALDEATVALACLELLKSSRELSVIVLGKTPSGLNEAIFMSEIERFSKSDSQEFKKSLKTRLFYFSKHFSFQRRIRLVQRLSILITSHPGSLALASALGVRTLHVADSQVVLAQCGAYGNGHYVTEANTPDALVAHLLYLQQEWRHRGLLHFNEFFSSTRPELVKPAHSKRLLKSRILPAKEGGGVLYETVGQEPFQTSSVISIFHSVLARDWLCSWVPDLTKTLASIPSHEVQPQLIRDCLDSAQVLSQILSSGLGISQQLHSTVSQLKSENVMSMLDIERVQGFAKELRKIEELIHRACSIRPELAIFSSYYSIFFNELESHKLKPLAEGSIEIFETLIRGVSLFQSFFETLLSHKRATLVPTRAKILRFDRGSKRERGL